MLDHARSAIGRIVITALLTATAAAVVAGPAGASARSPIARAAQDCRGALAVPASSPARTRVATMCVINRFRAAHGRRPLRFNRQLTRAAQSYTELMTARRSFGHSAPGGGTMVERLRRAGYIRPATFWSVGENLGWGTNSLATPASMVEAWAKSPGHRRNLLGSDFREAGIGVATVAPSGAPGGTYTINFGARRAMVAGGVQAD